MLRGLFSSGGALASHHSDSLFQSTAAVPTDLSSFQLLAQSTCPVAVMHGA